MLPTAEASPRSSALRHNVIVTDFERVVVGKRGDWCLTEGYAWHVSIFKLLRTHHFLDRAGGWLVAFGFMSLVLVPRTIHFAYRHQPLPTCIK
jgi:hypothetical protein